MKRFERFIGKTKQQKEALGRLRDAFGDYFKTLKNVEEKGKAALSYDEFMVSLGTSPWVISLSKNEEGARTMDLRGVDTLDMLLLGAVTGYGLIEGFKKRRRKL